MFAAARRAERVLTTSVGLAILTLKPTLRQVMRPAASSDNNDPPRSLQCALAEYEYARNEVHLRLGFSRQVFGIQLTALGVIVGLVATIYNKGFLSSLTVSLICVVILFANVAFVMEYRQNSLHTIITGNFIRDRLLPEMSQDYVRRTGGGLLAALRREREGMRTRVILRHYRSDSFIFTSVLVMCACSGVLIMITVEGQDVWRGITFSLLGALACYWTLQNLWDYAIRDPAQLKRVHDEEMASISQSLSRIGSPLRS